MRRVLLTLLALLLAAVFAALWYAYEKGFTSKWRAYVTREFHKRGVEVTLRRLTLDPVRGLVAKDVRVLDANDRRRILAAIDEMALQVNYANLVRGKPFLDALDLRDASISLPLDPQKPRGQSLEISKLNARLFLPPQQIYLAHADAVILGLHVSASGRLIHPEAFRSGTGSEGPFSPEVVARIFEEVQAVKFEGEAPVVSLTFSGDLAEPEHLFVDVALWGERLRRKQYTVKSLYALANYRAGVLDVKQFAVTDTSGELRVTALWELDARRAQVQLRSSIDAPALARTFGDFPWLDDFIFYTPPHIDLRLTMGLGEQPSLQAFGHIRLKKSAYHSVVFDHADADFSWDGERWSLRDVKIARAGGEEVTGDAMQVAGDFRARLRSTMNPKVLRPLLTGNAAEVLAQLDFSKAPRITFDARGTEPTLEALKVDGEVALGAASFRGVPAERAVATVHFENRVLALTPFRVERSEGSGSGNLYFDFRRDEVRFDKVKSSLNPPEVAVWIDPQLVKDILPYRFPWRPPSLLIDGLVQTKGGKTTRLGIQVEAPTGMDYTFLNKNLTASQASGKLLFANDRLKITDLSAALFGGSLKGSADISLVGARPGHSVSMAVENVDFASLTKLYFDYGDSRGRLNGRYEFTGRGDDARTMEGRGELSVTDGNVFAIPFLGPLSGVLNSIVPGMGHDVAHRANSTFTIADGVVTTDDLVVQGRGFTMIGNGKLFFLDDRMDFNMRINARGLPGVLLFPVSKLFEYTADQKLSKPVWRPKLVPRL